MKVARVIEEHKTNYIISDCESEDNTELIATLRGVFFEEDANLQFPKVGDFVEYSDISSGKAVIEEVKDRTSTVSRRVAETGTKQVIVANVDIIFIVMGLDNDFNINRLERYLLLAQQCEVESVVILNKKDCVEDPSPYINKVKAVAKAVPVYAVSALSGNGMNSFLSHIKLKTTAVLLGSSGAGKSTITNWLIREDAQTIGSVRSDDSRGRHTTTSRQLFTLPTGGYLIDTPGMRELSILEGTTTGEESILTKFDALSHQCKFTKCDHDKSEGCAIILAIANGEVTDKDFKRYKKIEAERLVEEGKYNEKSQYVGKKSKKRLRKN